MNYTPAASGGSALTYPIQQINIDLSGSDFTKLNTTPLEVLPSSSGQFYCPINITLTYNNTLINSGQNFYLGFESLLNVSLTTAFTRFETSYINNNRGVQSYQLNYLLFGIENTIDSQPLVIWQQLTASFSSELSSIFLNDPQTVVSLYFFKLSSIS